MADRVPEFARGCYLTLGEMVAMEQRGLDEMLGDNERARIAGHGFVHCSTSIVRKVVFINGLRARLEAKGEKKDE